MVSEWGTDGKRLKELSSTAHAELQWNDRLLLAVHNALVGVLTLGFSATSIADLTAPVTRDLFLNVSWEPPVGVEMFKTGGTGAVRGHERASKP